MPSPCPDFKWSSQDSLSNRSTLPARLNQLLIAVSRCPFRTPLSTLGNNFDALFFSGYATSTFHKEHPGGMAENRTVGGPHPHQIGPPKPGQCGAYSCPASPGANQDMLDSTEIKNHWGPGQKERIVLRMGVWSVAGGTGEEGRQ